MSLVSTVVSTILGLVVVGFLIYEFNVGPQVQTRAACKTEVTDVIITATGESAFSYDGAVFKRRSEAEKECRERKSLLTRRAKF